MAWIMPSPDGPYAERVVMSHGESRASPDAAKFTPCAPPP